MDKLHQSQFKVSHFPILYNIYTIQGDSPRMLSPHFLFIHASGFQPF